MRTLSVPAASKLANRIQDAIEQGDAPNTVTREEAERLLDLAAADGVTTDDEVFLLSKLLRDASDPRGGHPHMDRPTRMLVWHAMADTQDMDRTVRAAIAEGGVHDFIDSTEVDRIIEAIDKNGVFLRELLLVDNLLAAASDYDDSETGMPELNGPTLSRQAADKLREYAQEPHAPGR